MGAMSFQHIIFDFNGTLVDSSAIIHEIVAELIKKSRFRSITSKDFENPQDLPLLKRIKVLIFTAKYARKFLRLYSERSSEIPFADGVLPMLTLLGESGFKYSILSSNSQDMIRALFKQHNLPIGPVYKAHRLSGKKSAIKSFIKHNRCSAGDVLYIGDEKRDVEVCNKCGVGIIFVKWGLGANEDLSGYKVKAVANTPAELTEYLLVI